MSDFPAIPGFRIVKKLGQGGMADVYEAVQQNLDRKVAIKVIIPELFRDASFAARFVKEAQTAAKLSHPHVLHVYDVGSTSKCNYIVMECLRASLKERLKNGPLSPAAALDIMRRMGEALDYAHDKGFVHRDIKPDNILFRENGTPVLTDFGIAKALDSTTKLTRTGTSVGTPHYMSPEQIRGSDIDGRADFYSLGVVFYEMLIGQVPYEATDPLAICMKHLHEPIPVLPGNLARYQLFLEKLLAKDPEQRVSSGSELQRRIEDLICDSKSFSHNDQTEQQTVRETQEYSSRDRAAADGKRSHRMFLGLAGLLVIMAAIFVMLWSRKVHRDFAAAIRKMYSHASAMRTVQPQPKNSEAKIKPEQLAAAETEKKVETEKPHLAGNKNQKAQPVANRSADSTPIKQLQRIGLIELDPQLAQEYGQRFQRILVSGIPENVNVFGQISILVSVDAAGGISIDYFDTQLLTVDPLSQQEQVRALISGVLAQVRLLPPKNRDGQAAILEKWRLGFKTSTLAGKITLLRQ